MCTPKHQVLRNKTNPNGLATLLVEQGERQSPALGEGLRVLQERGRWHPAQPATPEKQTLTSSGDGGLTFDSAHTSASEHAAARRPYSASAPSFPNGA